jgi:site-specific DNA-methyltransferase (adenine-specific)
MMIVHEIPLSSILVEHRERKKFGNITALAEQINIAGGLINPILVSKVEAVLNTVTGQLEDKYRLVAGERRLRACTKLGYTSISAHIKDELSDLEYKYLELTENLERKDFEWWEEVRAKREIHTILSEMAQAEAENKTEDGHVQRRRWGLRDTAKKIRVSFGALSEDITLANLLDEPSYAMLKKVKTKTGALQVVERVREEMIAKELGRRYKDEKYDEGGDTGEAGEAGGGHSNANEMETTGGLSTEATRETSGVGDGVSSLRPIDSLFPPLYRPPSLVTLHPSAHLIHSSCIDKHAGLSCLANQSVDVLLTDPPYGINLHKTGLGPQSIQVTYHDSLEYIYQISGPFLDEVYRVLKPDSFFICFCSRELNDHLRGLITQKNAELEEQGRHEEALEARSKDLIWVKSRGGFTDVRFRFSSAYELILFCSRGRKRLTVPHPDIFTAKSVKKAEHAGQKPLALIMEILTVVSDMGEVICDPFAGLATTLAACVKLDRLGIGWELHEDTFGKACERVRRVVRGEEKGEDRVGMEMENRKEN